MKILHMADLQLGCNSIARKANAVREYDFYKVFLDACRKAIEEKVDAVVMAGDIFHYPGSKTQPLPVGAYRTIQSAVRTLRKHKIEVFIVSGNHDTPRYRQEDHPLTVIDNIKGVHVAHSEVKQIDNFLLIPWVWDTPLEDNLFDRSGVDVCVVHAPCTAYVDRVAKMKLGIRVFDLDKWATAYSYIALGDWHRYFTFKNAVYPSSLERTSFGEVANDVGCVLADITNEGVTKSYFESSARPMRVLDITENGDLQLRKLLKSKKFDDIIKIKMPSNLKVDNDLIYKLRSKFQFLQIDVFSDVSGAEAFSKATKIFAQKTVIDRWVTYCSLNAIDNQIQELGEEVLTNAD